MQAETSTIKEQQRADFAGLFFREVRDVKLGELGEHEDMGSYIKAMKKSLA